MNIQQSIVKILSGMRYRKTLEDQNNLLREQNEALRKKKSGDEKSHRELTARRNLYPIETMKAFVRETYEFRRNVVTDVNEYRKRKDGADAPFTAFGEHELFTVINEIYEAGIFVLDRYVKSFVGSAFSGDYHPVKTYLDRIRGRWDGVDRTADLMHRINDSPYALRMGRIWLRAVVAQWLGWDADHANSVMLLLVSLRQGMQKSTFLRKLLPDELVDYYTDDFSLNTKGNAQRKMVEFAIINMDEFDKENPKKMPLLKTLMQTKKPSFIGAYKKNFNRLPRIASFVGTSNTRELLHDRSGSRRFLILEPEDIISIDGIDHDQLFAQLVYEVEHAEQYYFDKVMETEMQKHNRIYYERTPLERLLANVFRPTKAGEQNEMSLDDIITILKKKNSRVMRDVTKQMLGKALSHLNYPKSRHHHFDNYKVVQIF